MSLDPYFPDMLFPTETIPIPVTPVRKKGSDKPGAPRSNDTTPSTIRERRGRITQQQSSRFRPLSVFTQSVLIPFDLDTDKALDVLKSDSPDRIEEAQKALTPSSTSKSTPSPSNAKAKRVSQEGNILDNPDMDLLTALQMTSPEKDYMAKVDADFNTLCELPIPEPSQHPAFCSNPFEVRTDAPLLFTSSSIDEIRLLNYKNKPRQESSSKVSRESVERKRSFFGLELRTPGPGRSRNAFSTSSDDSPLPLNIISPNTSNALGSVKGASPTPRESHSSGSATNSVRKFSDLFRRKDSMEKSLEIACLSPRNSQDSPNLNRSDLEKFLRRTTNTPTYDYDPYSAYPRHPNTGRGWKSRNLKCTTCTEESCAICRRVCCAYRAAVLATQHHEDGTPARMLANQRIQEITKLFPYGREAPTFLQCTNSVSGEQPGCGRLVCPDCCSVCPDDFCGDTLCRKCKKAMWEECDWHRSEAVMIGGRI